jgi:hypothetical protein
MDGSTFFLQHSLPEICYCDAVLQAQDWPAASKIFWRAFMHVKMFSAGTSPRATAIRRRRHRRVCFPSTGIFMENWKRFRHLQNACGM